MRDPERIGRLLGKIQECWIKYPDFRLCQLIINATQNYGDLWYVEDDDLEIAIDEFDKYLFNWNNRN